MLENDFFKRIQENKLRNLAVTFPIVCLVGPRQSGKTTLARHAFPSYQYVSLEDLDNRSFAEADPRGFLNQYSDYTIIDEAQRVPGLFSYIQTKVDQTDKPGQYLLTGSAHLSLLENLAQSLAGRVALLKLLPLSLSELSNVQLQSNDCMKLLFRGFYPRIYKHNIDPNDWYPNYIQTYIEKD
ncbi:MAG: AAA family ATPase, partial [Coxiellaceae bacterium]|nr:AAA family ATPase [Coxiellaceae bacterium]